MVFIRDGKKRSNAEIHFGKVHAIVRIYNKMRKKIGLRKNYSHQQLKLKINEVMKVAIDRKNNTKCKIIINNSEMSKIAYRLLLFHRNDGDVVVKSYESYDLKHDDWIGSTALRYKQRRDKDINELSLVLKKRTQYVKEYIPSIEKIMAKM